MPSKGVILVSSSVLAAGTFVGSSKVFNGGRSALVVNAAAYGATVQLQVQSAVNSSIWIAMNSTTINADSVTVYDVPAGNVRMSCSGSSAGLTATLVTIPYI